MHISEDLENYISHNSSPETELLMELQKETYQKTIHPYMISGFIQGRFLSMLSKIISPKHILEIGTFTGYATLCLAEGLTINGEIITIDKNPELEYISSKYFNLSEHKEKIKYICGNALEIIPNLNIEFDLIFLDADKENYLKYLDVIKPKLKKGGILLVDNVLWYGKVVEKQTDEVTQTIKDFNKQISEDKDFEVIILPIRDGISMIKKNN